MRKLILASSISAIAIATICSCSTGGPKTLLKPSDYYPLKIGNTWTYRVTSYMNGEESSVVSATVVEEANGVFTIKQGESAFHLVIDENGLLKKKNKTYAIKSPVCKDTLWNIDVEGLPGVARILDHKATVSCANQNFNNCVVIEEKFPGLLRLVSYYCPKVGLVKVEEYAQGETTEVLLSKAELLAYSNKE